MFVQTIIGMLLFVLAPIDINMAKAGQVIVREKIIVYEVRGNSARELRQYMKENGPPFHLEEEPKKRYYGFTHRDIDKLKKCSLIVITNYIDMPRWSGRKDASRLLQFKWDRMVRSLLSHERDHGKINIEAAHEHLAAKCKNKEAIKKRRNQRNEDFDKRNRHGATTGVHLYW